MRSPDDRLRRYLRTDRDYTIVLWLPNGRQRLVFAEAVTGAELQDRLAQHGSLAAVIDADLGPSSSIPDWTVPDGSEVHLVDRGTEKVKKLGFIRR
jgi:hypothetical protein